MEIYPRYMKFVDEGYISEEDLKIVLKEAMVSGEPVYKLLVQFGFLTGDQIAEMAAESEKMKTINISAIDIDPEILKMVPKHKAEDLGMMPIGLTNNTLSIVVEDHNNYKATDWLEKHIEYDYEVFLATGLSVIDAISKYYAGTISVEDLLEKINWNIDPEDEEEDAKLKKKVIELVDQIILEGVRTKATDIHVNPDHHVLRIRYRIDGKLTNYIAIPKKAQDRIISVLKLKAAPTVRVEETRKPQDGGFSLRYGSQDIDFRFSSLPVQGGENIVMRILDPSNTAMKLSKLGMPEYIESAFSHDLDLKQGIILVTGPTGSGKTTTLYTALRTIDSIQKNVMTLEDPVEYKFPVIRQTQINSEQGLTFASGLRSHLRQDPDVILVGEMRDKETIDVAMKAASTGHLVLSTLHTNSSVQTISRLVEMGCAPYLVVSTVKGIIAQRLMRRVCPKCAVSEELTYEQVKSSVSEREFKIHFSDYLETEEDTMEFSKAVGCNECNGIGYKGRVGIYEYLQITPELAKFASVPREDVVLLEWVQENSDFLSLKDDAIQKAIQRVVTFTEAIGSL